MPLSCVHRRGRCEQIFWPTASTHILDWLHYEFIRLFVIACNSQAWSGSESCGGYGDHIPCVDTHIQSQQGHKRNASSLTPPPIRLCSIKPSCKCSWSPGKQQDWSRFGRVPISCQKWCKMVPEWLMVRTV